MMRRVQFILVLTKDAPDLGMPLTLACAHIDRNVAAVQESFWQTLGKTFAIAPTFAYRSKQDAMWNLWDLYRELEQEGLIEIRSACLQKLVYVQVWHPQPFVASITGTQMATPVGRCLDKAGPIEDFLGLRQDKRPINPASTMQHQARGRIRHEIEHGLGGPHPELIFGNWWDYGLDHERNPSAPGFQEEAAKLNHLWLPLQ